MPLAWQVAVMAISKRLIARLGLDLCLLVVLSCYPLRFLGYAFLPRMPYTWVILPIQLLHGITFGLYWTSGVQYAASCAPKGLSATFQGAFSALISAGQAFALTFGGWLLDRVGGSRLYGGSAAVAACVGLIAAALVAVGYAGGGNGGGGGGLSATSAPGRPGFTSSVADAVLQDFADPLEEDEGADDLQPTLLCAGVRSECEKL